MDCGIHSDPTATLITPQSERSTRSRKRQRSPSPPPTPTSSSHAKLSLKKALQPTEVLLELPSLLVHPPGHKSYVASIVASLASLRACAAVQGVAPDVECKAWIAFAELGLRCVGAGWCVDAEYFPWASGLDDEVEAAIGRALVLVQQCPSLGIRSKLYLTILHSQLAHYRQNTKFSRSLLKRVTSAFVPPPPSQSQNQLGFSKAVAASQPPTWLFYTAHLTGIAQSLALSPPDTTNALLGVQELQKTAVASDDSGVVLLSRVLRLRTLVDAGIWNAVGDALVNSETALGLSYDDLDSPKPDSKSPSRSPRKDKGKEKEQTFVSFDDPFEAAMAIHVLVIGVVYYTHVGVSKSASSRLTHLHALLDSDALSLFPDGFLEIKLNHGPPLIIKGTHPRVLYHLAYLVSSVSRRDVVGRKPRRKVFASEGLAVWDKEMRKEAKLPIWANPRDGEEVDERMVKIKADLLSELAAVCIMRSEFDEAENALNDLIAHTRTYDIFPSYAARITLHHAHLAHALGNTRRARLCYERVAELAEEGTAVGVAARAGLAGLKIGCMPVGKGGRMDDGEMMGVVESCRGMGGTLEAVGHVLHACLSREILTAKNDLKAALDRASRTQDNHLRGLVLALVSALYFRTAPDHARQMLETCGTIAAGMGAVAKKGNKKSEKEGGGEESSVGNAVLGLWVGQRFLELYKREGNEHKAKKQEVVNARLEEAVMKMEKRWRDAEERNQGVVGGRAKAKARTRAKTRLEPIEEVTGEDGDEEKDVEMELEEKTPAARKRRA